MARVGLVIHEDRPEAVTQATQLAGRLTEQGHAVRRSDDPAMEPEAFVDGLDLVVSMGGDGSILRAVHLLDGRTVPVLGVNFGHLGYLTTVEPTVALDAVGRFMEGDHDLETRMMLRMVVGRADGSPEEVDHALNEVVVGRAASSQTIRVGVSLDGAFFTSYAADGLLLATPTGSTAYAFSARGPIVDARHRSIQLTPVSAHMLFDRTLVLEPSTEVVLEILGDRPAACAVAGRDLGPLAEGDRVTCTASERTAHLVTFGGRDFLQLLKAKFGLEDR